jgi:hypothetical protein
MLQQLDLSGYPDVPYVTAQREAILGMQQQLEDIQNIILAELPVNRQRAWTSLHVFQTLIQQKNGQLMRLYPTQLYNLWRHAMIRSSVVKPSQEDFADFPGEDSVAAFVHAMSVKFHDLFQRLESRLADLRARYPDYQKYMRYQIVTGGMPSKSVPFDDFPGDDSLEPFVRELFAEMIPRKPV